MTQYPTLEPDAQEKMCSQFNSDSPDHARRMNFEAAKAVKYGGLTEEEALI